ncbi:MAG TPA: SDR family oxidoreductase [Pirellulales bacterium]|jgi:hypothetical protein|nr:SDR family oxidoreductase [Pirellulales bacterium]
MNDSPGTALITGATSGIGLELARLFARDGWELVLVARRAELLNERAGELRGLSGRPVHAIVKDLAVPGSAGELVDELRRRETTIDALVNNAGFGAWGLFAETDPAAVRQMVDLNAATLTELTRLLLPPMIARRHGRILNVASTAAFQPGPLLAVYFATKAYVLSLSMALANELAPTGVTVTVLCPGPTPTEFAARAGAAETRLFAFGTTSTEFVARTGYRAMLRGKRVVIPGVFNQALAIGGRLFPLRLVTSLARLMTERA